MPARDGTGKILRAPTPAMTAICNYYPLYGQSNSNGTNALMVVESTDSTQGAAGFFGRDGSGSRDGTTVPVTWTNIGTTPPQSLLDFSALPNNTIDEPCHSYAKEAPLASIARVLNARQIKATGQRHFCRLGTWGQTGFTIAQLTKGTNTYTNFINGVTKMYSCGVAQGYTPIVRAVPYIQGEADFGMTGTGYAASLATMQSNIETDIKAITGQSQSIPLVLTQQSNFSNNVASGIPDVVLDQLLAHVSNPGKIVLAGPMYAGETDGIDAGTGDLHFRGHQGIRWHSMLGNCLATLIIDQQTWNPVMPKVVSRVGNVITVQFYVPVGSLVLDTSYVTNTTDGLYGFDFHQTGGTTTLVSVNQTATDTLQFTLSNAPDGTSPFLRAGRNSAGVATSVAGFRTGARTCLRDSADPDPRFCNYCVHFDQPIT
jgi:hypothetical protein